MTNTKVKETITRVQERGGTMTSDQPRKMIKEIWGEDGRDEKNEEEGAGLSGMVEGGGAGLAGMVKGAGTGRAHVSEDINTSDSYPLVDPRLEEAYDNGTIVQSTGADRSLVQPLDMMVNPPYSQHLRGDRIKGDRKNGDRNRGDRFKDGDRNKEWPGTRKGAKTRDIRYIKEEDISHTSDKDREKKQNQAKANSGIKKGDINDTGVKDGEEQQNQATRSDNRCRGPVVTDKEENPGNKGNQAKNKATGDGFKDSRLGHAVLKNIRLYYSAVRNI